MKHIVRIYSKPEKSGVQSVPDGAINGNGDIGLILGNCENGMRIYISKLDLWQAFERHDKGGMKPLGYIDIPVSAELYKNYYVEQDMDRGELRCIFKNESDCCEIHIKACRVENSIMLEAVGNVGIAPELKVFGGETTGENGEFEENGCKGIFRIFRGEEHVFETHAYAAMRKLDDNTFYAFIATNHDTDNPKRLAVEKATSIDTERFAALKEEHYSAWSDFWLKSSFEVEDEELELGWYASQYFIAGCTANKKFPPGLYANFITVENPMWHSDYHMNYNYQAPFYAACSSNHVEFTDSYAVPLEEFEEKGRRFARKFGCNGIVLPVGLMPGGICSELDKNSKYSFERLFLGQKSNAVHAANIMVFRWKATRDTDYAREHAYPFIKSALEFFEDYMTYENGRYSVKMDAAHEVPYYKADFNPRKYKRYINDMNNSLTLGMIRLCIPAAIDMASTLGIDEDKQKKWQYMLDKLSPFATYYRFGKRVFRYTEKGQMWNDSGDVVLQFIYPGCCVGLASDEKTLKIARNTFKMKEKYCWSDGNAVSSFFPMAARLGKDPKTIIGKLRELNKKKLFPNMLYDFEGGCLENCPIFANTLNEMAMQSFEGILRIFPAWDKDLNCRFGNLRADGAFLVSSEIIDGEIAFVQIESEAGQTLIIQNPFERAIITIDGKRTESTDEQITIKTDIGSRIYITK